MLDLSYSPVLKYPIPIKSFDLMTFSEHTPHYLTMPVICTSHYPTMISRAQQSFPTSLFTGNSVTFLLSAFKIDHLPAHGNDSQNVSAMLYSPCSTNHRPCDNCPSLVSVRFLSTFSGIVPACRICI